MIFSLIGNSPHLLSIELRGSELNFVIVFNHVPNGRILFNKTYYEVCQIQKYDKGRGHYNAWHVEVDGPDSCVRPFSMIIYLNDVEMGGETSFLYTGTQVKPRKGSLLIFPSSFPFVHRGEVPISHDKYIIATWLAYRPVVNS
mgnify:CR=1 FL=1